MGSTDHISNAEHLPRVVSLSQRDPFPEVRRNYNDDFWIYFFMGNSGK